MPSKASTESAIDGLYRGDLAAFVRQRNALVATLRDAGRRDEADRVKALTKPSVAAWAINGVYWNARSTHDRVIAAGGRLRRVQQQGLGSADSGDDVKQAGKQHRESLVAAVETAARLLTEAGHQAAPVLLRRIERTFEALAAGVDTDPPGRLTGDLEPPGFESLLSLAVPGGPARKSPGSTKSSTPDRKPAQRQLAERKAAVADARREARRTAAVRGRAEAVVAAAEARLAKMEKAVTAARQRLEAAKVGLVDARAQLSEAERAARSTVVDAEAATRAVSIARDALDAVRKKP